LHSTFLPITNVEEAIFIANSTEAVTFGMTLNEQATNNFSNYTSLRFRGSGNDRIQCVGRNGGVQTTAGTSALITPLTTNA
jgi:hypothetical protein